ncbi:MAG: hypothetical protein RLY31_1637 [Bacteroidota bacterium]|jgi:hypothetical protein
MNQEFWNKRYEEFPYSYGTEPNVFFRQQLAGWSAGRIFLPAEGQGRNAVFAARSGWEVIACDISEVGKDQALSLAGRFGVDIDYRVVEFGELILAPAYFDAIGLIYAHFAEDVRRKYHRRLLYSLKPGGRLVMEAFSKDQLGRSSGGPRSLDMLYDVAALEEDFHGMSSLRVEQLETELDESEFHRGMASVIRVVGVK